MAPTTTQAIVKSTPQTAHPPTPETRNFDLAGYCAARPNYRQTRSRLNYLTERYLSLDTLSDRLIDLPSQFTTPHQRPWQPIHWHAISMDQIVGVDPELFLQIIASSVEIEAPIKEYSHETWSHLQQAHPQVARFIGGLSDDQGKRLEVGIWEKEERQHAPAFGKIYSQLTGQKLKPVPNSVAAYQPATNPRKQLYRHCMSRITTEWSAVSIYLWLMAHSTGELQNAIAQPLQDEVNHLAKFWGMARWGFGDATLRRMIHTSGQLTKFIQHNHQERSEGANVLKPEHLVHGVAIAFSFSRVMRQLYRWNSHLRRDTLNSLFGSLPTDASA